MSDNSSTDRVPDPYRVDLPAQHQWPALATDPGYGYTPIPAPPATEARAAFQPDGTPTPPDAAHPFDTTGEASR
jgi:hypothetical protein